MGKYNEKFFNKDGMQVNSIDDLVTNDENILWRDKPNRKAFIWSKVLTMLPFALIWILFDGFFIGFMFAGGIIYELPWYVILFLVVFFLVHLTPFWIWLSNVITSGIQVKNMEYCLTDKRIIIKTGIFIDVQNIYYADVTSVNVRVGLIDRIFKVGDIYVVSKNGSHIISDIKNPYVVCNNLQKIVQDIKLDAYFPNDLRPNQNSGYNTKYTDKR